MSRGPPGRLVSGRRAAPRPHLGSLQDACRCATSPTSEHAAQDLTADLRGAGLIVGHDPARGRQDGNPEPVITSRQIGNARIDAPTGLRYPRDFPNHRLAIDIFELDAQFRHAGTDIFPSKAADISLTLEHLEHIGADLGGGRGHDSLARPLPIPDPRQHVAEWIAHRHGGCPFYQLDLTTPGICPEEASSRSAMRDSLNFR